MGQHGSKSAIEARVIFQRAGTVEMCHEKDTCCNPASVVHTEKKKKSSRSTIPSWHRGRRDAGGLVYVMDNPTGGVWVKPGGKWTRSWSTNEVFRQHTDDGIKSSSRRPGCTEECPKFRGLLILGPRRAVKHLESAELFTCIYWFSLLFMGYIQGQTAWRGKWFKRQLCTLRTFVYFIGNRQCPVSGVITSVARVNMRPENFEEV